MICFPIRDLERRLTLEADSTLHSLLFPGLFEEGMRAVGTGDLVNDSISDRICHDLVEIVAKDLFLLGSDSLFYCRRTRILGLQRKEKRFSK